MDRASLTRPWPGTSNLIASVTASPARRSSYPSRIATICAGYISTTFWNKSLRIREWEYRRAGYRQMAEHLGSPALESDQRVYALEQMEAASQRIA